MLLKPWQEDAQKPCQEDGPIASSYNTAVFQWYGNRRHCYLHAEHEPAKSARSNLDRDRLASCMLADDHLESAAVRSCRTAPRRVEEHTCADLRMTPRNVAFVRSTPCRLASVRSDSDRSSCCRSAPSKVARGAEMRRAVLKVQCVLVSVAWSSLASVKLHLRQRTHCIPS